MSTNDVPGAKDANHDILACGAWAEHDDGSLIFVEAVEAGRVVYSMFDLSVGVEYRDAMPETGFKDQFSWKPDADDDDLASIRWTWHDKTPMPWDRIFDEFPAGPRAATAVMTRTASSRVAESLQLRAENIMERHSKRPTMQRAARTILTGLREAVESCLPG